jgi:hypothetical protein
VVHIYNPSYLEGWDREDHSSKPVGTNSSQGPISKIIREKWTGGIAQGAEHLFCEHLFCKNKALSSKPSPTKKKNWLCWNKLTSDRLTGEKAHRFISCACAQDSHKIWDSKKDQRVEV